LSWWQREQDTEELIESGRAALAELHVAANRLNAFVAQLEALVADERKHRQREMGDDADA
jgi:hypothetical protein